MEDSASGVEEEEGSGGMGGIGGTGGNALDKAPGTGGEPKREV